MPILECASGIAYLAHLPDRDRQHILATLRLLPDKVSAHELHLVEHGEMLEEVREQGYATRGNNRFTLNPGKTSSIAVPLLGGAEVVGALTLAFFSAATSMREAVATFVPPLQKTARVIAAELATTADN
jgi:IclR family transcriptional regulator, mhp operon transcriptional activator